MSAAARPDNATCPRCGGPFRCGARDPSCACFGLAISTALRQQLAAQYEACLCIACLAELQLRQAQEKQEP